MKTCSASLVSWVMFTETTKSYQDVPAMTNENTNSTQCWQRWGVMELIHGDVCNVNVTDTLENNFQVFINLHLELTYEELMLSNYGSGEVS